MNRLAAIFAAVTLALGCSAPAWALSQEEQTEVQIGQQEYQQLQQKGEIISSSPYYATLNSIAARIAPTANAKYFAPFHFILVHENQPNAFSVPGGNVYVTDSMMHFVQNKEELAGVLCHEVSHDIHHDVYNEYVKDQRLSLYAGIASVLFGRNSGLINTGINLVANLQALRFSRNVEHDADHTGAYLCAQSGIDPYGMVWLMQHFEQQPSQNPPEFLSDHPSDSHRVQALHDEFSADPATFANYNPNEACATPVSYAGWYDQHRGGCGATRRQSSTPPSRKSSTRPIAPVGTAAKPNCPPGWKFC